MDYLVTALSLKKSTIITRLSFVKDVILESLNEKGTINFYEK